MNRSQLKASSLFICSAALLSLLVVQHQRLHCARLEHADLLIAASKNNPPSARTGSVSASAMERDELERLRSEGNELRNLRAKRDEMNRKAVEFQARVVPPPPAPVPEGKVKPLLASITLTEAPPSDRSTPMAALHQLILATQRGDARLLAMLRAPGAPTEGEDGADLHPASPLQEVLRYNQAQLRLRDQDVLEDATTVNLMSQRDLPDGRVELSFGFGWGKGGDKGRPLGAEALLRNVEGQWFFESLKMRPRTIAHNP